MFTPTASGPNRAPAAVSATSSEACAAVCTFRARNCFSSRAQSLASSQKSSSSAAPATTAASSAPTRTPSSRVAASTSPFFLLLLLSIAAARADFQELVV
eukprot:CAMPEP_0194778392 /NCGR_PEP_ID=MMETSP0323_2-20130528/68111_1 /TAXON_ID=2866 ORGANISM="Crypthecodinium cohnii, Strain Seligo" /NCGR_SAMPLE_ID=MMETSP0323_2 /ASSEMBLY_ACC=CAM_ASM_000346 /LENGTH=99 /DNA_ID=CAMNT_0039715585 /DNA_START=680 /DNA_END=975 /DNA_ORIENTATION=-